MFKGVYKVERWTGRKTEFHKRYYVFDGIGFFFFDTLVEARAYICIKASHLKNLYDTSKNIYKKLSECYFDKLIKFRVSDSDNQKINFLLSDCLSCYKFLSRQFFPQYILSKLKHIYTRFLDIANILKLRVLSATIRQIFESFFVPYPLYKSTDYQNNKNIVNLNNNKNEKKCLTQSY